MSDRKTFEEFSEELALQICKDWQMDFLAWTDGEGISPDFSEHVGPLSGGCRTCWPVLKKVLDRMAGTFGEVTDALRRGPETSQSIRDFFASLEDSLSELGLT